MRAIDADNLKQQYGMKDDCSDCEKETKGKVKSCEYDRVYTLMDFCGWIDDMPTIEPQQTCEYWDSESKFCALCRPSAQPTVHPQRTCVNCGRTVNNGGWYVDGRTRCPIEEHYALPKDGYCHLWEKRNVTDDDYPERREE